MKLQLSTRLIGWLLVFLISTFLYSQQNESQDTAAVATDLKPKILFSVNHDQLTKNQPLDSIAWLEVNEQKHIVIKHLQQGRKNRGNLIILHTQGENPNHLRLIKPLSLQLSNLGWNVFIPNIAIPDFPIEPVKNNSLADESANQVSTNDANITSNSQVDAAPANETKIDNKSVKSFAFKSSSEYQEYYNTLCQEVLKLASEQLNVNVIVANGTAAFWSLKCLSQLTVETPVAFLSPTAPIFATSRLNSLVSSQIHPLFTFATAKDQNNPFVIALKKKKWGSMQQRYDESKLNGSKLNIEDVNVAKSITGWLASLKTATQ